MNFSARAQRNPEYLGSLDSVIFIQCVGSMDENQPYCSRVCCTHSSPNAVRLKKEKPEMDIFILCRESAPMLTRRTFIWKPKMKDTFEPTIIGFLCNWCSYAGGDLAGLSRLEYPPNMKAIQVMCTGMVHPDLVLSALKKV